MDQAVTQSYYNNKVRGKMKPIFTEEKRKVILKLHELFEAAKINYGLDGKDKLVLSLLQTYEAISEIGCDISVAFGILKNIEKIRNKFEAVDKTNWSKQRGQA